MVFLRWKDAQLACKRCPLRPLLTPFWSPTKHLFKKHFVTTWFYDYYKVVFYIYFELYIQSLFLNLCKVFSDLCQQNTSSIRKESHQLYNTQWACRHLIREQKSRRNLWLISWKIVTLHAFSKFRHFKIVEWRMTKWKWSTAWTSRFAFGKCVW